MGEFDQSIAVKYELKSISTDQTLLYTQRVGICTGKIENTLLSKYHEIVLGWGYDVSRAGHCYRWDSEKVYAYFNANS